MPVAHHLVVETEALGAGAGGTEALRSLEDDDATLAGGGSQGKAGDSADILVPGGDDGGTVLWVCGVGVNPQGEASPVLFPGQRFAQPEHLFHRQFRHGSIVAERVVRGKPPTGFRWASKRVCLHL